MNIPDPGGAICTACGAVGSAAYNACNTQVAQGIIPPCAAPKGGTVAPTQAGAPAISSTYTTPTGAAVLGYNPAQPAIPGSTFFAQIGQKIGLFLVALTLIAVGLYITFSKQIDIAAGKAKDVAVKAAEVGA